MPAELGRQSGAGVTRALPQPSRLPQAWHRGYQRGGWLPGGADG